MDHIFCYRLKHQTHHQSGRGLYALNYFEPQIVDIEHDLSVNTGSNSEVPLTYTVGAQVGLLLRETKA